MFISTLRSVVVKFCDLRNTLYCQNKPLKDHNCGYLLYQKLNLKKFKIFIKNNETIIC